MNRLARIFPALCFIFFGAHLMFHGFGPVVSLLVLIPTTIVFFRHPWCAALCAVLLIGAGAEWCATAWNLAHQRMALGLTWMRAATIVGTCALATWLAAGLLLRDVVRSRKSA